jgi:hypothetical protein
MDDSDNKMLIQQLREACNSSTVSLPSDITFNIYGTTIRMHLSPKCVEASMLADSAAFEGWALALKRWLPHISHIEINWTCECDEFDQHYQRFLFRLKKFKDLFNWFSIIPMRESDLDKLGIKVSGKYYITSPKKIRETPEKDSCKTIEEALQDEHKLECFIKDNPDLLLKLLGIEYSDRQFPVGLFHEIVSKGTEIFPRANSAIDLWGVDNKQGFFLFELKRDKAQKMGIFSELFFYSSIIEGIQDKRFHLQKENKLITDTKRINSYILAPQWHPLIDIKLLNMVNDAFRTKQSHFRFGAIRIVPKAPQIFRIELRAWEENEENNVIGQNKNHTESDMSSKSVSQWVS